MENVSEKVAACYEDGGSMFDVASWNTLTFAFTTIRTTNLLE
jgi:hypothetical protein